jgi:D-alanine-D-alanine ligase
MDKVAAKKRFAAAGLSTPPYSVFPHKPSAMALEHVVRQLGFPIVVKPIADGSSLNVTLAADPAELQAGMLACMMGGKSVLLEKYVHGREFTVGIVGDQTLPVIELIPGAGHAFYDYDAKYNSDTTRYAFDIDLPVEGLIRIRALAAGAHRVLGCRDLSRVDIMLDGRGNPWLLEVNTIPGFTGHSLVPKAAAKAGITISDLCDRLVRMAMARALHD